MSEPHRGRRRNRGFTLPEILVALCVAAALIAGVALLLTQFQQWFARGSETGGGLQDLGVFLAFLRHDLVNLVGGGTGAGNGWATGMQATPERLSLLVFLDEVGTVGAVDYIYKPDPKGGTISRIQANGARKVLIQGQVASLSWFLGSDSFRNSRMSRDYRRVWLDLQVSVGGQGNASLRAAESSVVTKFFPYRLNHEINDPSAGRQWSVPGTP